MQSDKRIKVQGSIREDAQIDEDQFCGGQSVLFWVLKAVELNATIWGHYALASVA